MGELINLSDSSSQAKAYLARPGIEPAPGILVFHAWWGLNAFMRQLADRLSESGFAVLALDYYQGAVATGIEQAEALCSQVDRKVMYGLARQALERLLAYEFVQPRQAAVMGFSLGCGPALELARSKPTAGQIGRDGRILYLSGRPALVL